ncbi:PAS domain-containing sensor histidine kinase [Rhizobium grahamii]|uniref:histidine kinase n=1 Tax=Rhizobium grahamii CCGE 502 TaxID=990285 RepID=S3HE59_9HYPH|nr:PAS domain-containing sensor histidine kinase [Rhizobium grahamii]EPE96345.1 PAS/PAC sensor signal transduction histidine kinase [Rhizobium grahamii CCGE 502]
MDYEILTAEALLDALLLGLDLDLAAVALRSAARGDPLELTRCKHELTEEDIREGLKQAFSGTAPIPEELAVNGSRIALFVTPIGEGQVRGHLVVGSARSGFPTESQRLIISHAVLQANAGFKNMLASARPDSAASSSTGDNLTEVIDSIPGLAWSAGPDGSAEYFNDYYLRYVGQGADSLRGVGWATAVHPDDIDELKKAWSEMLASGKGGEAEARLRRSDGEYRWFLFRTNPFLNSAGTVVRWYGLNVDIEDRKRAAEALQSREFHLHQLTETIPQALWSATPDGAIRYLNKKGLDFMGVEADDLTDGFWWAEGLHPDQVGGVIRTWQHAVATGAPYNVEVLYRRPSGEDYRWADVRALPMLDKDSNILMWYGSLIDIHDRKVAQEDLEASERRLQLIIDTIPGMVWSARPDGSGNFANRHFRTYLGLSMDDARERGWASAVHPEDLPELTETWRKMADTTQPWDFEARLRRFDGEYRWFLCRGNPLVDASDGVEWFGVNVDIHDWKVAQDELREAQVELAHMTRMMGMGQLTAAIAHELSQPLSGITVNASAGLRMLSMNPPEVESARETIRRTIRDASRATEVTDRIRALYSKSDPVVETVDLNEIAQEVIGFSHSDLRKNGVNVKTSFTMDLPVVNGDRVQLQQVIFNLVKNGIEAMSGVVGRSKELQIGTARENTNYVRLSVRDAGSGLDSGMLEKLFSPFFTTKSNGMGVGLSVSRAIVESHEGRLWAESNDPHGAVFTFSIPLRGDGNRPKEANASG